MRLDGLRPRRARLSLTPVIDVVFLLLLFFMLASTFGRFAQVELSFAGGEAAAEAPAVVLTVEAGGIYRVEGARTEPEALGAALAHALGGEAGRVLVRPAPDASAQDIVRAVQRAQAAALGPVVLAR